MRTDVREFVRKCRKCQQYKPSNQAMAGFMKGFVPMMKPGMAYSCDIVGPLPLTFKQNRFILVFVDLCTKFVIAHPMRKATATAVQRIVIDKVVLEYGKPNLILFDNGKQFNSKMVRQSCAFLHIKTHFTPLYFPQANKTERYNRSIKLGLSILAENNHRDWDVHLPYVIFALRTAKNATTGFSPAFLTFGRELSNLFDLYSEFDVGLMEEFDAMKYASELKSKLTYVLSKVKETIKSVQEKRAEKYNCNKRDIRFEIGDLVWRKNHSLSSKVDFVAAKMQPKWVGPFFIAEKVSPTQYRLADLRDKDSGRWHVSQIKHVR